MVKKYIQKVGRIKPELFDFYIETQYGEGMMPIFSSCRQPTNGLWNGSVITISKYLLLGIGIVRLSEKFYGLGQSQFQAK